MFFLELLDNVFPDIDRKSGVQIDFSCCKKSRGPKKNKKYPLKKRPIGIKDVSMQKVKRTVKRRMHVLDAIEHQKKRQKTEANNNNLPH